MAPALGRRTPQKTLSEGRPKRQAVLNRKDNVEIAKGSVKGATTTVNAKKETNTKKPEKATNASNSKSKVKPTKNNETEKATIKSNETGKLTAENNEAGKATPKKSAASTRKSSRLRSSQKTDEEDTVTEEDSQEESTATEEEKTENELDESVATEEDDKSGKKSSTNEEDGSSSSEDESLPDDGALDDDGDSDFDPNDDPDKLWCFCKKPHGNRFMICCDTCEDWFHGDCVGITMAKGREMEKTGEEWCCRLCKENAAKKATRDRNMPNAQSALNSPIRHLNQKPLDPATLSKARSLSLDSMKNNLGKKIKDRHLSAPTKAGDEDNQDDHQEEKAAQVEDKAQKQQSSKRRESTENSLSGLLTFDHVPTAATKKSNISPRKLSTERRESLEEKKKKESHVKTHKVRTTPTPKNSEPIKVCHRNECPKQAMKGSIYCSRECIYRYTNECIKQVEQERKKNAPETSTSTKASTVISPAHSTTESIPTETTQERIAVFEKSTGKIVAGVMAPTKKYLFAWLEEHPTYQVLLQSGKQEMKHPKKNQDEIVRSNVRKTLKDVLANRCKESHTAINVEAVGFICKKIEQELLKMFGETNHKYRTKYRSLIFNLKDQNNKVLYKRVVSGEITPNRLVAMNPEQLAAPELAAWREHESKHDIEMIKKREMEDAELRRKFPGIKKTHKGEVELADENLETLEAKIEPERPSVRKASVTEESTASAVADLLKDTTDEHSHHLFDSNCKICTGKITPPGENQITGVSTTIIQAVPESSVPSPNIEDNLSIISSPPSPEDSTIPLTPTSPVASKIPPSARKQPSVWRGYVMMQKVAKFVCTAYAVSGKCENLMEILPDKIHVCGRIPPNQVWEYLAQLKEGRKNYKYIDVIRFEMSSDEEKAGYIKLYTYFYTRQRIGVVGNCYSGVKDMYILPLASHDPIPDELKPLPGLPKPRPHMLVGIIVRLKSKKKLDTIGSIDSSPEISIPKKKKKKKKEKEQQLEKEKIEIEAQKKLIDIIFKNRSTDLAISTATVTSIPANTEPGTSTSGLIVDPVSLLKSIRSPTVEAKTPTDVSEKPMEIDEPVVNEHNDGVLPVVVNDPNEEEQLRLMKEQQEEIEKLKAKLGVSETTYLEKNTGFESAKATVTESETSENTISERHTPEKTSTNNLTSQTDNTTPIKIPDPESMAKTLQEGIMKVTKIIGNEHEEASEEDMSREILREALQRTKQTEQKEAEEMFKDGPQIPLLGGQPSELESEIPSSVEENTRPAYSTTPSIKSILSHEKTSQPSDDDYVTNLIGNIEIPTQGEPKLPLDALKEKKAEMPELPAIDLPSPSDLAAILTAVPPQVPLPPNIKLPPGVPFPPLPPPPPTKTVMSDPRRRPTQDLDSQWQDRDDKQKMQLRVSEPEYRALSDPRQPGPTHNEFDSRVDPSREPPFARDRREYDNPPHFEHPPTSGSYHDDRGYPPPERRHPSQERGHPAWDREHPLPQDRMLPSQDRMQPPSHDRMLPPQDMASPPDREYPAEQQQQQRGHERNGGRVLSWRDYELRRSQMKEPGGKADGDDRANRNNEQFPLSHPVNANKGPYPEENKPQHFDRPPAPGEMPQPPMDFHHDPPRFQNKPQRPDLNFQGNKPGIMRPNHARGPRPHGDFLPRGPPGNEFRPRGPPNQMEIRPRGPTPQGDFPPRGPHQQRNFQPMGHQEDFQSRGPISQRNFRHRGPAPHGERQPSLNQGPRNKFLNPRFTGDPRFRGPTQILDNRPRFQAPAGPENDFRPETNSGPRMLRPPQPLPGGPEPQFKRPDANSGPRMLRPPQPLMGGPDPHFKPTLIDQPRPRFNTDREEPFHHPPASKHYQEPNQSHLAKSSASQFPNERHFSPQSTFNDMADQHNTNQHDWEQHNNDKRPPYHRDFDRDRSEHELNQDHHNRFNRDKRNRGNRHHSRNNRYHNERKRRHSESSDNNADPWGRDRRWHETKSHHTDVKNPSKNNSHDLEEGEVL